MPNINTKLPAKIGLVDSLKLDSGSLEIHSGRGYKVRELSNIRSATPYEEANILTRWRYPEKHDRRLQLVAFYSVFGSLAIFALPIGGLATPLFGLCVGSGLFAYLRDAAGVIAVDINYKNGGKETIRVWENSSQIRELVQELDVRIGGPGTIHPR